MKNYYEQYLNTLNNEVMPYWLKYSKDESGAINNCLKEDGTVMSKDRFIWSQGRALWTFSCMYNEIEKNPEYLERAHGLFNYLLTVRPKKGESWNYLYDEFGNLKAGADSIYVDGFVLAGMTEYYKITKNPIAKEIALEIYEHTLDLINHPGSYGVAPRTIPEGMEIHGVYMVFSFFYFHLAKVVGSSKIASTALAFANKVLDRFYNPEKDAVIEFIRVDGTRQDTPAERLCMPGHTLETLWFIMTIFEDNGEMDKVLECCRLVKRHFELGWENGSMCLAIDIDGKKPVFRDKADFRAWWVHCEALVATAYAYKYTKNEEFLEMHEKVNNFAFSHYPNGYGDWINWLDSNLQVAPSAALPVKDPFHLPRALIYLTKVFKDLK
ncbi:MAG: AGE family epimerase/isomerase [Clostridia bacterium]|nr:AGE family epimerase/isomerase [Clostridia bacterium]